MRQHGLRLDQETANVEVRRWLREVANVRVHAQTGAIPTLRLEEERGVLQRLPAPYRGAVRSARPQRREALGALAVPIAVPVVVPPQHSLSVYDALMEAA